MAAPGSHRSSAAARRSTRCWPGWRRAQRERPGVMPAAREEAPRGGRDNRARESRKANEGIVHRDLVVPNGRRVTRAVAKQVAAFADDLQRLLLVREPFGAKRRIAVGNVEMEMRLGRVAAVPHEAQHLSALDLVAELHANRPG